MVDDLSEAINHYKEKAQMLRGYTKPFGPKPVTGAAKKYIDNCLERAEYNEQVAAWLTELQERREADKWISVKERLPEDYTKVLITNEYGIVICVNWNTWYQNEYEDAKKEYKAIAWRPLPEPYESEANND